MTEIVSAIRCSTYKRDEVCLAVAKAIDATGNFPNVEGKHVLIKPNLLTYSEDCIERGVCTHPEVVYAVGKYVIEHGGILDIADTPGGRLTPSISKIVYDNCGISKVAEDLGVTLNYNVTFSEMLCPNGKQVKNFLIIDAVKKADIIISVCKLKTHVLMHYTGAVKNTFGLIPGLHKSVMHRRFQTITQFADALVDLNELIQPDFVIMDAIIGMEGDGPNNGQTKKIGYLLASSSIYAEDVVAQEIINVDPKSIPTTAVAINRNKITLDAITTVGDSIEKQMDFKMPVTFRPTMLLSDWTHTLRGKIMKYLSKLAKVSGLIPEYTPKINPNKCNLCGVCVRYCPSNAIRAFNDIIDVDKKSCIHCTGCDDICKQKAIVRDSEPHFLGVITKKYHKLIFTYPKVNLDNCVGCAQCANICSVGAAKLLNKKAKIDTSLCIRCFCCHEMCSYNALEISKPIWKKVLRK